MTKTYHQTIEDPPNINARQFQSKGTNQEILLLIYMVSQKMYTRKPDGATKTIQEWHCNTTAHQL
jgi:hypothetical protein